MYDVVFIDGKCSRCEGTKECPSCGGTGEHPNVKGCDCPTCKGTGDCVFCKDQPKPQQK